MDPSIYLDTLFIIFKAVFFLIYVLIMSSKQQSYLLISNVYYFSK